jgi:hypothetical protein
VHRLDREIGRRAEHREPGVVDEDVDLADPDALAQRLVVLYDGAGISAWMDHDPTVAVASRSIAEMLVDTAIPRRSTHRAKPTSQQSTTTKRTPKARRGSPAVRARRARKT